MNGTGVSAVTAYGSPGMGIAHPTNVHASVHALYDAARARRLRTERTIETGTQD